MTTTTNGKNLTDPSMRDGFHDAYRVSWYGYISPVLSIRRFINWGIMLLPCLIVPPLVVIYAIVAVVKVILFLLQTRTIRLYANQEGIWLYQGLFPWQRSLAGVRWHNVDEATSRTGFISWLTRAYPVCITNRYTKDTEIYAFDIARGDEFVSRINDVVGQRYAGGPIVQPIGRSKRATALPDRSAPQAIE